MTDSQSEHVPKRSFTFARGFEEDSSEYEWPAGAKKVRQALGESLNASPTYSRKSIVEVRSGQRVLILGETAVISCRLSR